MLSYHPHLLRLEGINFLKSEKRSHLDGPFPIDGLFMYTSPPVNVAFFSWYQITANSERKTSHVLGRIYRLGCELGLYERLSDGPYAYLNELPSVFSKLFRTDLDLFNEELFQKNVHWCHETLDTSRSPSIGELKGAYFTVHAAGNSI